MAMSDYETLAGKASAEISIKGSRFIGVAMPCPDEGAIQENLAALAKEYPGATHYCYAAIYGASDRIVRFSDGGEPSGTAGRPILSVLSGAGLSDSMAAVIRYFGGTLLGTGGLVRAYSESASFALERSDRVLRKACAVFSFDLGYSHYSAFESKCGAFMARRPECSYSDRVSVKAWVPLEETDGFLRRIGAITDGHARPIRLRDEYV
jgi:uncharacterized YigZ family protein